MTTLFLYDGGSTLVMLDPLPEGVTTRLLMLTNGPYKVRRLNDGQIIPVFATHGNWLWTNDGNALPTNYYEFVEK